MKKNLFESEAARSLQQHCQRLQGIHLMDLFAQDPQRFERYSLQQGDLFVDYSKHLIDEAVMKNLHALLEQAHWKHWREAQFSGEKINATEQRAVLHTALRYQGDDAICVEGENIVPEVRAMWDRLAAFSQSLRSGEWRGFSGRRIRHVVNIGIGGSDLGPKMVVEALAPFQHEELSFYFVSNVDGEHLLDVLKMLDPETTLFIIASKTFTTQETMCNAQQARRWFLNHASEQDIAKHFVAVSSQVELAQRFGIAAENCFSFWDWVGGRYSLWSAIGLPIILSIGFEGFRQLLAGAASMDQHFRTTDAERNLPVILALLGVWYNNFFDAQTHAVLPYDHLLRSLPAYLQQAAMESNGKNVDREGHPVDHQTGEIIWGASGINGQHAFYQLLHQGTKLIPADFIVSACPHNDLLEHHNILVANCLAQTEALLRGRSLAEVEHLTGESSPHKVFPGGKPSTTIILNQITPHSLGELLAMYEHKIFVQSMIWHINAYDQWGVELGKQLTHIILPELTQSTPDLNGHDASTRGLIEHYRDLKSGEHL